MLVCIAQHAQVSARASAQATAALHKTAFGTLDLGWLLF